MLTTNNPYDKLFSIANLYENKENEFRSKYPELYLAMNWDFMIEYRHGRSNNTVEVTIFRLYEHLEDFQNWLNKLDTLQYRLRSEYINQRLKHINEYILFLESDSNLIELAKKAFLSSLLEDTDTINFLRNETVKLKKTNNPRTFKTTQIALGSSLGFLINAPENNPIKGKTHDEAAVIGYFLFRNNSNRKFKNAAGIRACISSSYHIKKIYEDDNEIKEFIITNSKYINELLSTGKVLKEVKKLQAERRKSTELSVNKRGYKKKEMKKD